MIVSSRLIINVRASVFDMQLIKISPRASKASGLKRNDRCLLFIALIRASFSGVRTTFSTNVKGEGKNEGEKGIQLYNIFTHGFYSNYPVKCWAKLGEEKVMRVSASSTRKGREGE